MQVRGKRSRLNLHHGAMDNFVVIGLIPNPPNPIGLGTRINLIRHTEKLTDNDQLTIINLGVRYPLIVICKHRSELCK